MNHTFIRKAIENILYKSAVDEKFRMKCLTQGKSVIEKELNKKLDKDVKVSFKVNDGSLKDIDLSGKDLLFILPDYVGSVNKLDKKDLDKITGGISNYLQMNNRSILNLANHISFI